MVQQRSAGVVARRLAHEKATPYSRIASSLGEIHSSNPPTSASLRKWVDSLIAAFLVINQRQKKVELQQQRDHSLRAAAWPVGALANFPSSASNEIDQRTERRPRPASRDKFERSSGLSAAHVGSNNVRTQLTRKRSPRSHVCSSKPTTWIQSLRAPVSFRQQCYPRPM